MMRRLVFHPAFAEGRGRAVHDLLLKVMARSAPFAGPAARRNRAASPVRGVQSLIFPSVMGVVSCGGEEEELLPAWDALGFGFREIGPVASRFAPRAGCPASPRRSVRGLRLREELSSSPAAERSRRRVAAFRARLGTRPFPLGIHLAQEEHSMLENTAAEYVGLMLKLYSVADYFVVGVDLPSGEGVDRAASIPSCLAEMVLAAMGSLNTILSHKPVLVKITHRMERSRMNELLSLAAGGLFDGVIVSYRPFGTLVAGSKVKAASAAWPPFSGMIETIRHISNRTRGTVGLIGEGPLESAGEWSDAREAGAVLWQMRRTDLLRNAEAAFPIFDQGPPASMAPAEIPAFRRAGAERESAAIPTH